MEDMFPETWTPEVEKLFQTLVRQHVLQFDLVARDLKQAIIQGKCPSSGDNAPNLDHITAESCRIHFALSKRTRNTKNPSRPLAKKITIVDDDNPTNSSSAHTSQAEVSTSALTRSPSAVPSSSLLSLATTNDDFNILRDSSLDTIIQQVRQAMPSSIEAATRVHADSASALAGSSYNDQANASENTTNKNMTVRGQSTPLSDDTADQAGKASDQSVNPEETIVKSVDGSLSTNAVDGASGQGQAAEVTSPTGNMNPPEDGFNPTTMDIETYTQAVLSHILKDDDRYDEMWKHVGYEIGESGDIVVDMKNKHLVREKYDLDDEDAEDTVQDSSTDSVKDAESDEQGMKPVDNYHARYITSSRNLATAR